MADRRSADYPAQLAREVLAAQKLDGSAPVPVEKVARNLGAQVRFSPMDDELSGMIFIKDNVPIIGVNALHHLNRQRFTISHECGHWLMHKDRLSSDEVHVDKSYRILMRDPTSALGTETIEVEANRFAAELLMPRPLLEKTLADIQVEIDDDEPMEALARKFKVSRQMLEFRLRNFQHGR